MILHVMIMEKFLPPFIDFVDKYFDVNEHKFVFITSPKYKYGLCKSHSVEFLHTDADFVLLSEYFDLSDKIILHGLWRDKVNTLLCSNDKWMDLVSDIWKIRDMRLLQSTHIIYFLILK